MFLASARGNMSGLLTEVRHLRSAPLLIAPPVFASVVWSCGGSTYLVTRCLVGVTVVGTASEIENVNHVFQPEGRLAASNSP
jgi:hypothetical protein